MHLFSRGDQTGENHQSNKRRGLRLTVMFMIVLSLAALSFLSSGRISSPKAAKAASWNLVWDDEFNGSSGTGVNTSNWLYDTGTSYPGGAANWGTGEVETMTNSTTNVFQDGSGHLVIDPVKDGNGNWTSGRIETQNTSFAAPSGGELEVTASIQMPAVTGSAALGYWPAFWMLGSAFRGNYTNWPSVGEIDIMEGINGLNKVYGTLHCGTDPKGPCNETTGLSGNTACPNTTCEAGYHTYTVIVDRSTSPEQIRWYVDGTEYWSVSSNNSGMDATTWANAVDHGFFIILNVAMGGAFPNAVCGCTSPSSSTAAGYGMHVDYVQVYTAGGSTSTPTATPTSSGSCSGTFAEGVVDASTSTALPWFEPCGWTAGYVILHYIVAGGTQENVYMAYNSSTSRWEYTVPSITSGQVLSYAFTYQESGLQYDTSWYSWTHP